MNTTLSHSTTHPPDTQGREVLDIPAPDELRALSLADRLTFRVGLWLLRRAQRPHRSGRTDETPASSHRPGTHHPSERENAAVLAYHLRRQLL